MSHVVQTMMRVSLACLLPLAVTVGAQQLKGVGDPTRPPPGVMLRVPGAGAGDAQTAAGAASAAASAASAAVVVRVPVALSLTAIRYVADSGAGVALINEKWVQVGEKVAGMTVTAITREDVLLKGPSGGQRLTLFSSTDQPASKSDRQTKRDRKEKQ